MALLGSLLGNAFSDNPVSTGDVMSNYFGNRYNQDMDRFGNVRSRTDQMSNQPVSGPAVPGQLAEIPGTQGNISANAQPFAPYQVATVGTTPPPPGGVVTQPVQPQTQVQSQPLPPANGLNASQLQNGTGPTQIPAGVNAISPEQVAQAANVAPASTQPVTTTAQPASNDIFHDRLVQAGKTQDPAQRITSLRQLAADPNTTEDNRNLATQNLLQEYQRQQDQAKNMAKLDQMTQTDIARQMKSNDKEGNWFKYYIANRLGLTAMADNEANKLGYKNVTDSETISNPEGLQRYTVTRDGRGNVVRAFDTTGREVGQDIIAQLSAQAFPGKGTHVATQAMKDSQTGVLYHQRTLPNGTYAYVDDKGQAAPDTTRLRPYGIGSDLETKNQIQLNALQNKLAYAPITERAKVIAEHEAQYGPLDADVKARIMSSPTGIPAAGRVEGAVGAPGTNPLPEVKKAAETQTNAPIGSDLSPALQKKIVSGQRSRTQQQAMYNETVAAGRPGIGPTGLPVAQVSEHEGGAALDMPRVLSRDERAELAQKGYFQPDPTRDPVHWVRMAPPAGAPAQAANAPVATGGGQYPAQIKQGYTLGTKQGETNIQTTAEQQRKFNEEADTLSSAGASAQTTADLRRQMHTLMMDPRSPIGFAQGQSSAPKTQLFQDIIAGKYAGEHGAELANDVVNATGFKQGSPEYNNVVQFANLQGQIMARSGALKSEFGNRVSNMDVQLFNKTAGGDMLRSPAYALFATNENNTIADDLTSARGDLAASGNYTSTAQFNRDWKTKQAQLENTVKQVKEARLNYINSLTGGVSDPKNVRAGFQAYPTPVYDTVNGSYQLGGASRAAVNKSVINPDSKAKLDAIRKKQQGQ